MRYRPGAREELEHTLDVARDEGLENAGGGMPICYLARGARSDPTTRFAAQYADAGIDYCTEHDLDGCGRI